MFYVSFFLVPNRPPNIIWRWLWGGVFFGFFLSCCCGLLFVSVVSFSGFVLVFCGGYRLWVVVFLYCLLVGVRCLSFGWCVLGVLGFAVCLSVI